MLCCYRIPFQFGHVNVVRSLTPATACIYLFGMLHKSIAFFRLFCNAVFRDSSEMLSIQLWVHFCVFFSARSFCV